MHAVTGCPRAFCFKKIDISRDVGRKCMSSGKSLDLGSTLKQKQKEIFFNQWPRRRHNGVRNRGFDKENVEESMIITFLVY